MASTVTRAQVSKCRQAIAELADLEQKIKEAKALDLPCEEQEARWQQMKKFLINWNEIHSPQFQGQQL